MPAMRSVHQKEALLTKQIHHCNVPRGLHARSRVAIRCQQPFVTPSSASAGRPSALTAAPPAQLRHERQIRQVTVQSSAGALSSWPENSGVPGSSSRIDGSDGANTSGQTASSSAGNVSFVQAVSNLMNILLGVGLLSLPAALTKSGWIGLAFIPMIALVTCYTGQALVECSTTVAAARQQQGDQNVSAADIGYEQVAKAAFGSWGKACVSATIYAELFGICSLFFVIMGDNLHHLLASTFGRTPAFYMLVAAGAMIPTVWLPDLKALSYLGFLGVSATAAVTLTVLGTFLTGSYAAGAATTMVNAASLPLMIGGITFCFSGHGIFPSVKASMKEPEQFPQALRLSFFLTAITCSLVAALGYAMYGTAVRDIVTFNLPRGYLSLLVSCLILVSPWAKFAVSAEPVAIAIDRVTARIPNNVPAMASRLVIRTGLALAMLAAARFCPFLSLLMALIGSFLTVNVSLIYPAVLHLKIHQGNLSAWRRFVDYFVIVLGVCCMVSGTWASVAAILVRT